MWLLDQALGEDGAEATLGGLARRLVEGGVPIARISVGRAILHPVIGLLDMQWDSETGAITSNVIPRSVIRNNLDTDNPFSDLAAKKTNQIIANLSDPDDVARYPIFADLAARGITSYAGFSRQFGSTQELYASISEDFCGATISFATKRFSGFSQADLEGLERLLTALCVCLRVDNERFVATEILETYLGRISGKRVLDGQIERGDGQEIECAIFYSDLRGSVALSQSLDTQAYLDTVNAYFDCTATAVTEHGGEVLKFIGDGVLAIFPFDSATRPRENMCAAALASAREAFARADHANKTRQCDGLPDLQFGVALHVGTVIYGNVGTSRRLDFTATGPAVGLASRCEAMTRDLNVPLIATAQFADCCATPTNSLGTHSLAGFEQDVDLVTYPLTD